MSRYNLVPKDLNHSVTVGWDGGLSTFFVIVKTHDVLEDDEHNIDLWKGTSAEEIKSVDDLVTIVEPYASLSDFVRHSLATDFLSDPGPSMLQRQVREMMGEN